MAMLVYECEGSEVSCLVPSKYGLAIAVSPHMIKSKLTKQELQLGELLSGCFAV